MGHRAEGGRDGRNPEGGGELMTIDKLLESIIRSIKKMSSAERKRVRETLNAAFLSGKRGKP